MKLKKILFESLSISDIPHISSFEDANQFIIDNNLKLIGEGSTRIVYSLNDKQVIKFAIEEENIDQNLIEANAYKCLGKRFAAEIFRYDSNGFWLVMEKVQTLSDQEYKNKVNELLGFKLDYDSIKEKFNIDDFTDLPFNMELADALIPMNEAQKNLHKILCENSEWFRKFNNKIVHCKVHGKDLGHENFGLRGNKLVLIDYAFELSDYDAEDAELC